jgi:hypothetical protein
VQTRIETRSSFIELIRAIEPLDQEVVLANASEEVPLQEELKAFHLTNVWGQVSLTPCTKLAEEPLFGPLRQF